MGNQVTNYTFTVIEDGQVPLAGNFDTFSYSPVIAAVIVCLCLIAVVGYTLWFITHSMRLRMIIADDRYVTLKYFFHPAKMIHDTRELEYSLVNVPVNQ